jgi:hypothetical protein
MSVRRFTDFEIAVLPTARLGEGPRWDGASDTLLWVDISGKGVHRYDPVSGEDTVREAGASIALLRSSGGGAAGALWPQIVSDVTGLAQDVRAGPSQAGVGAALLAAICVGAATLETSWTQRTTRVEPDREKRVLYDELYGWFRELAAATRPQVHALAAWQRDHARETMPPAAVRGPGTRAATEGGRSS